jgi:hypothetical protein
MLERRSACKAALGFYIRKVKKNRLREPGMSDDACFHL